VEKQTYTFSIRLTKMFTEFSIRKTFLQTSYQQLFYILENFYQNQIFYLINNQLITAINRKTFKLLITF
jgi:hypothetical protein